MGEIIRFVPKSERERARLVREARAIYDSIFPPVDPVSEQQDWALVSHAVSVPMPFVATGFSCRDQDHRRALQSLLPGKLPRADRHHLRLRRGLNAILPDGRAAARGVDEAASGRAPGGVALRDRQTGWQGSLGSKAAFLGLARTTQPFASLEGLRARAQFPSKQITNDQDYYGRARYPGDHDTSTRPYTVEPIDISHRE